MSNRCDYVGAIGYMREFPDFRTPKFEVDSYNRRFHNANVIIDASATEIFYPEHWGGLSIKCAFNGSEHYRTSQAHYRVNDSSFLVFNEGNLYSSWIKDTKSVESFTLNMTPSFEREATRALTCSQNSMIDDPVREGIVRLRFLECLYNHRGELTSLMMQMRSLAKDLSSNHVRLEEMFFELFTAMTCLQTKTHLAPGGSLRPSSREELYQRLLRARDFMWSCFQEDLTLSDISDVACMNKFHFLRQFKKAFRVTPHQFLTRMRMTAACQRLVNTEEPVGSICSSVGYVDITSFSKLVKRWTGYSPAKYRLLFQ